MVAILARSDDPRVLVQFEGDLGFEGQPRAFKDDFWCELVTHEFAVYLIVIPRSGCYTSFITGGGH